jgi:hypothetical protein
MFQSGFDAFAFFLASCERHHGIWSDEDQASLMHKKQVAIQCDENDETNCDTTVLIL